MAEKWIVAFETENSCLGRYLYLRDEVGDIVVFQSKVRAQMCVLTNESLS